MQISEWEQDIAQAWHKKEHATRKAGIAEKNCVDVQMQHDRELKKSGKVTQTEEDTKELKKAVIKLCMQAEIKEGTIKDAEAVWDASACELSEVHTCPHSFPS